MTLLERVSPLTSAIQSASTDQQTCIEIVQNLIALVNTVLPEISCQIALLLHLPWDLPHHNYHLHLVCVCRLANELVVADPFPGKPDALLFGTTRNAVLRGDLVVTQLGERVITYRILADEAVAAICAINMSTETTPLADLQVCYEVLLDVAPAHAARVLMRVGNAESEKLLAQLAATTGLEAMYAKRLSHLPRVAEIIRHMHTGLQQRKL